MEQISETLSLLEKISFIESAEVDDATKVSMLDGISNLEKRKSYKTVADMMKDLDADNTERA